MYISKKLLGVGLVALVLIVAGVWWRSGGFAAHTQPEATAHADHGAGEAGHADHATGDACQADDACHEDRATDAHDHDADHGDHAAPSNLATKEIEQKYCEHKIRQIECQECRYELGVVKVDPTVTAVLTKTAVVQEVAQGGPLRLTGEVQYDQTTVVEVLPAAPGKVVKVAVRLGQQVAAGALLAVIHSGEFGEAKAAYLEALTVAEVAHQEQSRQVAIGAALERLLAAAKERPGSDIPAAETLGEWKARLVGAVARLRQAQTVRDRELALVAKQASSKAELETAERDLQTAQADYTGLLEEIQLNLKLDRLKAANAAALGAVKLNTAEQRLHLFGMSDADVQGLSRIKDQSQFAMLAITAPRAGVVTALTLTEGRFVEPSQSLFTIADTANLWVWCDLYERDLGPLHDRLVKDGQLAASVTVTAFAAPFPGVVDLLDSAVNEVTRTVKVRVQVKNDHGRLRPGMFATVDIPLTEGKKTSLVPRQAVLRDEGQSFAFVHWKDDLWLRREVAVGRPQGESVEILSGLAAGDRVVVGGGFLFKSDVLRAKMGAGCAD